MDLVFRDIDVSINNTEILKKISGMARRGDMLAVMGPSGAGKSTLLSALAGRLPITSGMITLNGELLNKKLSRKMRFVLQNDIFFPNLTLRQTLTFAALLTLPDKMPHCLKLKRVNEIVKILELHKCTDTVMGNAFILGLSGGEKKRAAIACEMLTDPAILLIDEPTSGIDASIAYNLVKNLQTYAEVCKRTVVASIHQPSSQIFHMFTNVLLIADGKVVYFGACSGVLDHFMSVGLQCKPHYNPADFMIEQLRASYDIQNKLTEESSRNREKTWPAEIKKQFSASDLQLHTKNTLKENGTRNRFTGLANAAFPQTSSKSSLSTITDENKSNLHYIGNDEVAVDVSKESMTLAETDLHINNYMDPTSKWPTGFWTQYKVLTQRLMLYMIHQIFSPVNVLKNCAACIIVSSIWFQIARNEETLDDRLGVIFFTITYWGFDTILASSPVFGEENAVIMRERSAGMYRLSAYWLAKQTSELPIIICMPLFSFIIIYWAVGLNVSVWVFFSMVPLVLLFIIAIQGIGLFIGVMFPVIRTAVAIATITMMSFMLLGGFYQRHLRDWISWLKYFSPLMYAYHAGLILEFKYGQNLKCLPSNKTVFDVCLTTQHKTVPGDDILQSLGIIEPLWIHYLVLFLFFITFRYAIYLTSRYIRTPANHK